MEITEKILLDNYSYHTENYSFVSIINGKEITWCYAFTDKPTATDFISVECRIDAAKSLPDYQYTHQDEMARVLIYGGGYYKSGISEGLRVVTKWLISTKIHLGLQNAPGYTKEKYDKQWKESAAYKKVQEDHAEHMYEVNEYKYKILEKRAAAAGQRKK